MRRLLNLLLLAALTLAGSALEPRLDQQLAGSPAAPACPCCPPEADLPACPCRGPERPVPVRTDGMPAVAAAVRIQAPVQKAAQGQARRKTDPWAAFRLPAGDALAPRARHGDGRDGRLRGVPLRGPDRQSRLRVFRI